MKQFIAAIAACTLMMAACNSTPAPKESVPTTTATTSPESAATSPAVAKITDPVCGMVKDSTWTDYTVYKGDTVWFCAAIEKKAFEAHPEKYAANLPQH